ncbi:class E sortase [Candidatus Gracilibacteria bacterium]|nr:class E sortase [Candidatus Gracilibacteria bacterium]
MERDPLTEYENKLFLEYQEYLLRTSQPGYTKKGILRVIRFFSLYILLSSTIFSVLLGLLNFNAYSARLFNWIDPDTLLSVKAEIQSVLSSSSIEVHASEDEEARTETLDIIEQKVAQTDPGIVYSRSYEPSRLLGNISLDGIASSKFEVAPYENRIIIPRLGKNVPLIDVFHDTDADYLEMHEIFMEELRKGVVRYPDTARPGEIGNVFIFGHSSNYPWVKSEYNDIFALLDTLKDGDDVVIFYGQKKFTYRITDRAIVKPGDMEVLESRDPNKKELALMTCWPIGTTLERIILFAELVENETDTSKNDTGDMSGISMSGAINKKTKDL